MPHKADESFFDEKKEWSKRKDLILAYYLKPYLAKVSKLNRPILLVDGFAGAGKYKSGEDGSPVIICSAVQNALTNSSASINVICVEEDDTLRARLSIALTNFSFAEVLGGSFLENLSHIEKRASGSTTFLYLDPYAIEGLEWTALTRLFRYLHEGKSIEVLLNFSAFIFARRALAALSMQPPAVDGPEIDGSAEAPVVARLNAAVGGDWWLPIVQADKPFPEKVDELAHGYCHQLRRHFREVCEHPIRAKWNDAVPKYSLVFGSRSPDALVLMNDATIKSRDILAEKAAPADPTLFETRPTSLIPDLSRIQIIVKETLDGRMTRKELTAAVVRKAFCFYKESQIHRVITELLKAGKLQSATGKSRINDHIEIWRN